MNKDKYFRVRFDESQLVQFVDDTCAAIDALEQAEEGKLPVLDTKSLCKDAIAPAIFTGEGSTQVLIITNDKTSSGNRLYMLEIASMGTLVITKYEYSDTDNVLDAYDNSEVIAQFASKAELQQALAEKADKTVLDKVEVEYNEDDDKTTFTFPEHIIPIRWYMNEAVSSSNLVFVNYEDGNVIDSNGTINEEVMIDSQNNRIKVIVSGKCKIDAIFDELSYILQDGNYDIADLGNWYKILNPSSGGTAISIKDISVADPLLSTNSTCLDGKLKCPSNFDDGVTVIFNSEEEFYTALATGNKVLQRGWIHLRHDILFLSGIEETASDGSFRFRFTDSSISPAREYDITFELSQLKYQMAKQ